MTAYEEPERWITGKGGAAGARPAHLRAGGDGKHGEIRHFAKFSKELQTRAFTFHAVT